MKTKLTIALLTAMTLGLAACGDTEQGASEEQTAAPQTSPAEQERSALEVLKEEAEAARESVAEAGSEAAATVASAARAAAEKGSEMMEGLTEKGGEMAGDAREKGGEMASAMGEKAEAVTDAAADKARDMIASVKDYLAENDLDSARGVMENLDRIKDSLPEALKNEIEALQEKMASMTGGDSSG